MGACLSVSSNARSLSLQDVEHELSTGDIIMFSGKTLDISSINPALVEHSEGRALVAMLGSGSSFVGRGYMELDASTLSFFHSDGSKTSKYLFKALPVGGWTHANKVGFLVRVDYFLYMLSNRVY